MSTPRTMLVGFDFSDCAIAAAHLAAKDLAGEGGTVVLMHAFQMAASPGPPDLVLSSGALTQWSDIQQAVSSAVDARLAESASQLGEQYPSLTVEYAAVEGFPEHALLEEAKTRGVDRIVVGTHGRRGLKHLVLGSVAERVVRLAEVPVLVVKAQSGG